MSPSRQRREKRGGRRALSALLSSAALLAASLAGCSLDDPGPPYQVMVYEHDRDSGEYRLEPVSLETLRSLRGLEGEVTSILGGVEIVQARLFVTTEADLADAVRIRGGRPVEPRYYLLDGVVVAEDFGSLLLFTYYRQLERCRSFFHEHGLDGELPGHLTTYHLPTFALGPVGGFHFMTDNAGYLSVFGALSLFPRHLLREQLPLAMNLGVVCHEYSHAVFHSVVAPDSLAPPGMLAGWPVRAQNLMRSVDEGIADLFGALATEDPAFIDRSMPEDLDLGRGLDEERTLTEQMRSHLGERTLYDPYPLGTVFASVLWRTKGVIGRRALAESGLRAMHRMEEIAGPDLDLPVVSIALHEAMDEGGREALCEAMEQAQLPLPPPCEEAK